MSANAAIFNPTESTSAATGDGFSVPRLTTTGRLAIVFGAGDRGMMVYDTTLNNLFIWNGSAWESVPASGDSTNTQVIFNDNGILAGDAGLTYDKTQARVQVGTRIDIWRGLNGSNTNVAVGKSALSATQAGANANTAVGNQAGNGLTTGANNVFVGSNAGFGGGTGGNNVAIGVGALTLNTAGNQNVSIGTDSLFNHTGTGSVAIGNIAGNSSTGNYNTFLGYASGSVATTATRCVAIGVDSFGGASGRAHTGANNIAIGTTAMYSANDISGVDNIGVGRNTLNALSSGAGNIGVGYQSLASVTTGIYNVGIGYQTLVSAVASTYNVGIGYQSLTIATGSTNTAIGAAAGGNITSGSSNICIGANAGTQSATNSNELAIGSNAQWVATSGTPTGYFTTASALSSGSLPPNCGFIRIYLNGSYVKIPVYGN